MLPAFDSYIVHSFAKAILPSLKAQNALCLSLAAKLSTLHDDMQELAAAYTRMYRERTGSVRSPFDEARLVGNSNDLDVDAMTVS